MGKIQDPGETSRIRNTAAKSSMQASSRHGNISGAANDKTVLNKKHKLLMEYDQDSRKQI
jgi:hypothetical protein